MSTPRRCLALCLALLALATSPLVVTAAPPAVSLAGEWQFELATPNADTPPPRALGGRIHLPGTMDDAGLGPKNAKAPTLEGPYRLYDYAGPAWYQRDIEIPADWSGRRVTLFLERCRWVTTVWLDDRRIGSQDSLIAPHVYELGVGIAPGRHRLTICVDNTVKIDLGRFVSALFGGTWGNMNGIVGRIELASTPTVWLQDVHVYPRLATQTANVKVRIGNATGRAGEGWLTIGTKQVPVRWDAHGGQIETEVGINAAKPWDEFSPNLTELVIRLGDDERTVSFGMREFAAKGTQFTLNGRTVYLRGTLECSVFPLTGYPPTTVAEWQRIYRIAKSYGLNHMRFHSWCPPEAAFTAADIEGLILQVEGPQANVPAGTNAARDAFIESEYRRIVETYGNHPSFCLMALGNEFGGDDALLARWVGMLEEKDPRHLYTAASNNNKRPPNRQFTVMGYGRGVRGAGTTYHLRDIVARDGRPYLGHEIGQWMFYPDFAEIRKYTGVMALRNFEWIRDELAKKGLLDQAPAFVAASGRFAMRLYKEEIEILLRTRGYGGFALLDLHDYPTQGTALIGPLDEFWDSKGFVTPEAFRRFCSATVPLLRFPKRTYTSDEPFTASAQLAHFGATDLRGVAAEWTIRDEQNHVVDGGRLPACAAPAGQLAELGSITASLAKTATPAKLTVTLSVPGTPFSNDWDIWVYPPKLEPAAPPNVFVSTDWARAKAALDAGQTVVFFATGTQTGMKGRFLPVFWSPVWFPSQKPNTMGLLCDPKHPLFARFPTDIHTDWQWYELMQHSRLFVLDEAPRGYRPIVQVIDNFARNHLLGAVFEARVGRGRLLTCGLDLLGLPAEPAARQLLAGLYDYVRSPAFVPSVEFSPEMLEKLFVPRFHNRILELGGKVTADSQVPGYEAESAIDADPSTLWHTPWDEPAKPLPHHLTVEFAKPVRLKALTYLPRQGGNSNGWIKDYAVSVSADGKTWGAPVAHGAFPRDDALQTIPFGRVLETRFVRLTALSGFNPDKVFTSVAELSAVTE